MQRQRLLRIRQPGGYIMVLGAVPFPGGSAAVGQSITAAVRPGPRCHQTAIQGRYRLITTTSFLNGRDAMVTWYLAVALLWRCRALKHLKYCTRTYLPGRLTIALARVPLDAAGSLRTGDSIR